MSARRVAIFMGTRPEAIKLAPVVRAIDAQDDLEAVVVSTGQHREMLQQVIDLFEIEVDHSLDVMQPDQTLGSLTARLMERIDALLASEKIDFSVLQGDTTTTLVSSLASFYRRIPIGHVEAGLRTGDLTAPFPEEANRKLTSQVTDLHFPPTEVSKANLVREGVPEKMVEITGNTVVDALQLEVERQDDSELGEQIAARLAGDLGGDWRDHAYVLVTGHRRENFGHGFDEICSALSELAERFPDHRFIYPVHLNPNVKKPVHERLGAHSNIRLLAPQQYREFVMLMRHAKLVLTDSGGIQEEAPSLGKPVLVMRETTERPEGVDAGTVELVGANRERIVAGVAGLLEDPERYRRMSEAQNPYGDGQASERIARAISRFLG